MVRHLLPVLRKSFTVWFAMFVGIGMITACGGGGGGGGTSPGSPDAPTISIASPSGTYFKEGENIDFSGSATDSEGVPLTGSALVWSSNIDGQIGTGETLISSALSPGDHNISLTATDAAGVAATATLPTITVAKTRFIKMGGQATDVSDAANAFDGDIDTAATITTPDTEFIYFKAYLGGADTFLFKIRMGASTSGSKLALQGLATNGAWQPVSDFDLDSVKTVSVKISSAQSYVDAAGYIHLRVRWEGGAGGDNAPVYEIWRIDPVYAGSQTTGVDNVDLAFDGKPATSATITTPWQSPGNETFLQFKVYVGLDFTNAFNQSEPFELKMSFLAPDTSDSLYIDAEDMTAASPGSWVNFQKLELNTKEGVVSVANVQDYLDADGYISLRARWVSGSLATPAHGLYIYEISRIDPFMVGPETPAIYVNSPQSAVDGDLDSYANIYYFWGESDGSADRYDFLHVKSYAGDNAGIAFSVRAGMSGSGSGSELVVEGRQGPDDWSVIERVTLDDAATTDISLENAREYIDAYGYFNIRLRWESSSSQHDAYIYEIWR